MLHALPLADQPGAYDRAVDGRTRKAIKADVRVHVDRLAAIMQPSMELAKRYAAAVAEDLA